MPQNNRIRELAEAILSGVNAIDDYNEAKGLPSQTFEPSGHFEYDYPAEIESSKQTVLEASDELHALLAGPAMAWIEPHHNLLVSQQAICRYKIANSFPEGEDTTSFEQLASRCGLTESQVRRIVKTAATSFIFAEPSPGVVAHTAASKYFATTPVAQQWIGMMTDELWPASTKVVDAMAKFGPSQEPNHTGFNIAHSTDKAIFEYLADKPERAARFAGAMAMLSTGSGYDPRHLVQNYPWSSLGQGTVVDIGGSYGTVAISLAKAFPSLKCIVQDRPEVVAEAHVPPELEGRLSFQSHDFFTKQPVTGADVYFLRWILHDWSDKYAIKILQAIVPALKPGAKVVLQEYILPAPGQVSRYVERTRRAFDIAMLELQNAKERDASEWKQLFAGADARFEVTSIIEPPQSRLGIVEATWRG